VSQDIRRELISKNLGIKPIDHGHVYTFQITIPDSRKQSLSLEQRQAIEQSLLAHQNNLISLIIRRTNAYADEDIEYELVYGADWLQIAQELNIEKVWAWVFDLTDEQTIAAITEMESLSNSSRDTQPAPIRTDGIDSDVATLIDKKLQLATDSIKNSITSLLAGIRNDVDEKLKVLNYKIDNLNSKGLEPVLGRLDNLDEKLKILDSNSTDIKAILQKLDGVEHKLRTSREIIEPIVENPINLLEASIQDIKDALRQVKAQDPHIRAAIEAIEHWKQSEQGLTWENLEISIRAKTNAQHKIKGFAKGTYSQLRKVATIPEKVSVE
jgi:hypothetical protein